MTKKEQQALIVQAIKLTTLGFEVEEAHDELKRLVGQSVPYDDPKMLIAFARFKQADSEWKKLEFEHLELQKRMGLRY